MGDFAYPNPSQPIGSCLAPVNPPTPKRLMTSEWIFGGTQKPWACACASPCWASRPVFGRMTDVGEEDGLYGLPACCPGGVMSVATKSGPAAVGACVMFGAGRTPLVCLQDGPVPVRNPQRSVVASIRRAIVRMSTVPSESRKLRGESAAIRV